MVDAGVFNYFGPWADKYGALFKIRLLAYSAVVLTDPDRAQEVLRKTSPLYIPKDRSMYWPVELGVKPQLPNILSDSDGPYWKAVRTAVAVCFSISNLKKVSRSGGIPHLLGYRIPYRIPYNYYYKAGQNLCSCLAYPSG